MGTDTGSFYCYKKRVLFIPETGNHRAEWLNISDRAMIYRLIRCLDEGDRDREVTGATNRLLSV
jgi:hypothetical protein